MNTGQGGLLVRVELQQVLQQRPPTALERLGLLWSAGATQIALDASAQLVERLRGPLNNVERIEADLRLRGAFPNDIVDPLGSVGRHVGQQLAPLRAEGVEERPQRVAVGPHAGPHLPAGVMITDAQDIPLPLTICDFVDTYSA